MVVCNGGAEIAAAVDMEGKQVQDDLVLVEADFDINIDGRAKGVCAEHSPRFTESPIDAVIHAGNHFTVDAGGEEKVDAVFIGLLLGEESEEVEFTFRRESPADGPNVPVPENFHHRDDPTGRDGCDAFSWWHVRSRG